MKFFYTVQLYAWYIDTVIMFRDYFKKTERKYTA